MSENRLKVSTLEDLERLPASVRSSVKREAKLNQIRCSLARTMDHQGVDLFRWQYVLCHVLSSVVLDTLSGTGRNVILEASPRVGKTYTIAEWCIPWAMRLASVMGSATLGESFPTMLIGNEQTLVRRTSRHAQANYLAMDGLFQTGGKGPTWTMDEWATEAGALLVTKGVRGNMTGGGYLFGVGDDLLSIGNTGKAAKDHAWDTFRREFLSRRMTGASTVLMAHRVAVDDVSGRWMDQMDENGIPYEVYTFRMEAEEDEYDHKGRLWRKAGDLLCPELVGPELVREAKADAWFWSTTYQQRPTREGGAVIREEWCGHRLDAMDIAFAECPVRAIVIDPAAKKKERNDPSGIGVVGFAMAPSVGMTHTNVLHVEAERREYPETRQRAIDLYKHHNCNVFVIEDTSIGQALAPELRRMGYPVEVVQVAGRGDKVARMVPFLTQWSQGLVRLAAGAPWLVPFIAEMTTVPDAPHDDLWDMMSVALTYRERLQAQRGSAGPDRKRLTRAITRGGLRGIGLRR